MIESNSDRVGRRHEKRATVHLAAWTLLWLITLAAAVLGPRLIWDGDTRFTTLAVFINFAAGVGMVLANRRLFRNLDELQQKVQLEAMATSLGVGLVFGFTYSTLDQTNLISGDAEIGALAIVMGLTYFIATMTGLRRYR
ncbi:MAG: hypothetical protein AAF610_00420 [Pseudomonadota bacterium]